MTRRERLMATLRGEQVDRPPVSFYEINGLDENPHDPDPFNIYSDPSWLPAIQLAREKTDRIVTRAVDYQWISHPVDELLEEEVFLEGTSRGTVRRVRIGQRILTGRVRRDQDVNTSWITEHLLKDADDLRAWLEIPLPKCSQQVDINPVLAAEQQLGDSGIVMIDTPDPLCCAASMFSMEDYTVLALTEPRLFHQLLESYAAQLYPRTELAAKALPGRLWRIYGPEYASPPYLPPALFREYVVRYVTPMIASIQAYGGYARIHAHGNLKAILDDIAGMGVDGLDPIEPPPQGDVELGWVREHYGRDMVLFGNLEASDLENLPEDLFREKVRQALDEGTSGTGRGFVLMPSACPYGRKLSARALRNYEVMLESMER